MTLDPCTVPGCLETVTHRHPLVGEGEYGPVVLTGVQAKPEASSTASVGAVIGDMLMEVELTCPRCEQTRIGPVFRGLSRVRTCDACLDAAEAVVMARLNTVSRKDLAADPELRRPQSVGE